MPLAARILARLDAQHAIVHGERKIGLRIGEAGISEVAVPRRMGNPTAVAYFPGGNFQIIEIFGERRPQATKVERLPFGALRLRDPGHHMKEQARNNRSFGLNHGHFLSVIWAPSGYDGKS